MKQALVLLAAVVAGAAGGLLVRAGAPAPTGALSPRPEASASPADSRQDAALSDLAARVAALEARRERPAAAPAAAPAPAADGTDPDPAAAAAEKKEEKSLDDLLAGPIRQPEIDKLMEGLFRHPERVDDAIARIRKALAADPKNPDLLVALASSLVAKLGTSVLPGPKQGELWNETEKLYDRALAIDPDHWEARYGKAYGTSMIPAFLGKRPEAIREFEELVKRQEQGAVEPWQAKAYLRLGTLYKEAGNPEKAREIWKRGVERHPEAKEIRDNLELLGK
jgi:tetratricopeptide (TPR) repeat protein